MMKVLVANRGEIAVRVLRACRDLGLRGIAVYAEGDREALHTRYAHEALLIGPTPAQESYLSIPKVLEAAKLSGADAVHPGYGFLSENAAFAEAVEKAGLIFIGPRSETLRVTGDKRVARDVARDAGLPVLSGPDGSLDDALHSPGASELTFPLLVKAVAGGGGRGIRLVRRSSELAAQVDAARREAKAAFGDDGVYLEPLVERARHIEVQILGDGLGTVLALGERECSVQRRRQKLIEESPAPGLSEDQRAFISDAAVQLGRALGYRSLGTVEFLLDSAGRFHFIEINPRIQVEHPVTEMVTGLDLVKVQLRLAAGEPLAYAQDQISPQGWAIEARVLAENPVEGFLPTTGEITYLKEPGGPGIRVDSALYQGMRVTSDYDSLLAKVIGWGETRQEALVRLRRALQEVRIGGVVTDIGFLLQVLESSRFVAGEIDTTFLDQLPGQPHPGATLARQVAAAAAFLAHRRQSPGDERSDSRWRATAWQEQM